MINENNYHDNIVPKTAVMEMTYQCNHQCLFCSVPWESPRNDYQKQQELTSANWKSCIDILIKHKIKNIAFSGGEPLLKKGLEEIICYARKAKTIGAVFDNEGKVLSSKEEGLELSLITNGELVTDYWVDIFRENRLTVIVSLPGIDKFNELTSGGNYKKSLQSIKKISDAGLDVVVSVCVTKKNLSELFRTVSLGFLHGAKALLLNRFLPGGRGINHPDLCLDKEEIIQMLDTAEAVCLAANTKGSVGTELPKCIIDKKYEMLNVGTMCSGGVDFFAIDPAGNIRPCNHSPVKLGVYTDILAAIQTNYWQKFKQRDFLPKACAACAFSMQCDSGCREAAHITSGALDSLDPLFKGLPDFPDYARAYSSAGLACERLGNYKEAIEWHLESIRINPRRYFPRDRLYFCFYQVKDQNIRSELLERLRKLDSNLTSKIEEKLNDEKMPEKNLAVDFEHQLNLDKDTRFYGNM